MCERCSLLEHRLERARVAYRALRAERDLAVSLLHPKPHEWHCFRCGTRIAEFQSRNQSRRCDECYARFTAALEQEEERVRAWTTQAMRGLKEVT